MKLTQKQIDTIHAFTRYAIDHDEMGRKAILEHSDPEVIFFTKDVLTTILGDKFICLPATGCTCGEQIDFFTNDKSIMLKDTSKFPVPSIAIKLIDLDDPTTYSEMQDVDFFIKDYADWMKSQDDSV